MAVTIPLRGSVSPKEIGLEVWMDRVLERIERVRGGWDADEVHDLRVALRRCRSMADALTEVNPGPGWRKLRKASRGLFQALGELRDTQVERGWVKKIGPAGDSVRRRLLRSLAFQEKALRQKAEKAVGRFDRKAWRKLTRKQGPKAQFFPLESVVFQRLALSRLNTAAKLFEKARTRRSRVAWHQLRIGIKNFRYVVENFLPQRSAAWGNDLRRMQDLLGDVHDLDVLRLRIRSAASKLDPTGVAEWVKKIDAQRKVCLQEFLRLSSGPDSRWLTWRAGLQAGHWLMAAASLARLTA